MSTQTSTLEMGLPIAKTSNWRNRSIALALAVVIAGIFWIDSRYPALSKKYHQGPNVKVVGTLTFDALYPVSPAMPLATATAHVSFLGIAAVAIISAFLPVPMAFDVIFAYIAMTRGGPAPLRGHHPLHPGYLQCLFGPGRRENHFLESSHRRLRRRGRGRSSCWRPGPTPALGLRRLPGIRV